MRVVPNSLDPSLRGFDVLCIQNFLADCLSTSPSHVSSSFDAERLCILRTATAGLYCIPRRDIGISSCCFGVVLMSKCSTRPVEVQPSWHRRMAKLMLQSSFASTKRMQYSKRVTVHDIGHS